MTPKCLAAVPALLLAAALPAAAGTPPADPKTKRPPAKLPEKLDLAAEVAAAEKACARPGASREDRERLAALYILAGQAEKGRKALGELFSPRSSEAALAAAAEFLKAEVGKLPRRGAGVRPTRQEVLARLRLASAALALDSPTEVVKALEPLGTLSGPGRRADKYEIQRLALLGTGYWRTGDKARAGACLEDLLRRATAGRRLGLRALTLVDQVRSYGVYTERAVKTVAPGESVLAYCEVLNFQCLKQPSGEHRSDLDVDLKFLEEVTDRRGERKYVVVRNIPEFSRVRHRTRSPLRDLHLVIRFNVPRELAPGRSYVLEAVSYTHLTLPTSDLV